MAKLSVSENFFKNWTPEMSYILGFIVADGCIIKRKGRKKSYILNITSKDRKHLFRIRKRLSSNHPVSPKYNSQKKVYYQIQFCKREICRDLINLGILPRKTHHLSPIEVPDRYFSDFVRGFFDGDGSVYIYEVNGTPQIKSSFVSVSLPFIEEFNKRLCKNLNISEKAIHKNHPRGKNLIQHSICFYIDDCEKLYKFIYKKASIFLDRKYRIFKKWENVKSKNRRHYIKQDYPSKVGWYLNQKVLA